MSHMEQIKEESELPSQSQASETAQDFIQNQLQLEADAKEILPYKFDSCTKLLGPLRQQIFSCLTCNPPPQDDKVNDAAPFNPAGICYACSISCHGEHELVELFTRRDFVCDCGTARLPASSPCTLRAGPSGEKGVSLEEPAATNEYNQNFRNKFCGCAELYDPKKERGTMFQCLGLGSVKAGGCGEDWWHPECLMGLPRDWRKRMNASDRTDETDTPANGEEVDDDDENPPEFPHEDDFETFICYKCVNANPWIKRYAGAEGFLPALIHDPDRAIPANDKPVDNVQNASQGAQAADAPYSLKRKAEEDVDDGASTLKKIKSEGGDSNAAAATEHGPPACKYVSLPEPSTSHPISLFAKEDFREHLCHCPSCFPPLSRHRQLLEEEENYSPPVSEGSSAGDHHGGSAGSSRSLLDRGEAALSNMDRVRAIEGAMAYNALRDNLRGFLRPFAESGVPVSAEDIKAHFEKLRGDTDGIRAARAQSAQGGGGQGEGDSRREQGGY